MSGDPRDIAACAICGRVDFAIRMRHTSIGSEDVAVCKDPRLEAFTADGDSLVLVTPMASLRERRDLSCELEAIARGQEAFGATHNALMLLGLPNPEAF